MTALRGWARGLRRDAAALRLAVGHPGVPWYAKLAAGAVAAYALSPIDLIPDFIPVLGLLDDLIIVPLGILLVVHLVPPAVMADLREQAMRAEKPRSRLGLVVVVGIWAGLAALLAWHLAGVLAPAG